MGCCWVDGCWLLLLNRDHEDEIGVVSRDRLVMDDASARPPSSMNECGRSLACGC